MDDTTRIQSLKAMRLPELRALFAEATGEQTRCPNKTFLARRIVEAQSALNVVAAVSEPVAQASVESKLTQLGVDELQRLYAEVIGRPTGSSNKRYLIWKIREAKKGRIRVGPRTRSRSGASEDMRTLPIRMKSEVIDAVDAAWQRLGLKSRAELFRKSLHGYFTDSGEAEVAGLISTEG